MIAHAFHCLVMVAATGKIASIDTMMGTVSRTQPKAQARKLELPSACGKAIYVPSTTLNKAAETESDAGCACAVFLCACHERRPGDAVIDETEMRHDTPSSDYHVDGGLGASRDAQATMQWVEDVFVFLRTQAHQAGATEYHICWLLTHAVPYPANMRERSLPLHMHWSRMLYLFV